MHNIFYSNYGTHFNHHDHSPQQYSWFGSDTQKLYDSNIKFFSALPEIAWTPPSIDYTFNNIGMRVSNDAYYDITDDYDFSDKIVVLGCSQVLGIGIRYEYTLGECLSKLFGKQVINWGVGGCGPDAVFHNAMWLATRERLPLKVIILWPQPTRFIFDNPENNNTHYIIPPQNYEDISKYYKRNILDGTVPEFKFKKYKTVLRNVFKERLYESFVHCGVPRITDTGTPIGIDYRTKDDLRYHIKLHQATKDVTSVSELLKYHYARDIYKLPTNFKNITDFSEFRRGVAAHQGIIPNKLLADNIYGGIN